LGVERREEYAPDLEPNIFLFPVAQAPPASAGTGVSLRQITPARPAAQDPQDAFQNQPIIRSRPAKPGRRRKERLNDFPLPIVEERVVVHPKLSTLKDSIVPAQNVVYLEINPSTFPADF
jgi:hypothetical protein